VTTATDHQGTTTENAREVIVVETIEIVAETLVTGSETEVAVGAVMTDAIATGIAVVVAGTLMATQDIRTTTGVVIIEPHVRTMLDSMAAAAEEEEVGARMEAFPMASVVVGVESKKG
jgi:hypothetical protein